MELLVWSLLSRLLLMALQKNSVHQISLQLLLDPGPGWLHESVVCATACRRAMHLVLCFYVAIVLVFLISIDSL